MSSAHTFRAHALSAFEKANHHRNLASVWEGEPEFVDQMRIAESFMEQGKLLLAEANEMESNND